MPEKRIKSQQQQRLNRLPSGKFQVFDLLSPVDSGLLSLLGETRTERARREQEESPCDGLRVAHTIKETIRQSQNDIEEHREELQKDLERFQARVIYQMRALLSLDNQDKLKEKFRSVSDLLQKTKFNSQ